MIQFNLLPDIKLDYIKAHRSSRLILSVSILVSAAALALLLLLLSIDGLQRKHLNDLSRDIKSESSKLQSEPQIDKILTVQNQLESLTTLHNQKPAVTNLFSYLNQLTPVQVSINNLHFDFVAHTASIGGTADALSTVNKYIDTLKFTTYTMVDATNPSTSGSNPNAASKPTSAFNNVVLSTFNLDPTNKSGAQASYTITLAYDPNIFDNTKVISLSVPNLITTRSQIDKPTDLFQGTPTPSPSTSKTNSSSSAGGQ